MISEEKVSVIMSVYNEKNIYLENSINSILNQSYKNIEFIIVLDNPDNKEAEKTILRFMNHDKRIIFIKNSYNIGLTKSLNKALNKISGDYVCRMDADDISYSKRIEWQINHIKAYDIDLLGGGKDDIDENGNIVNKFKYVPNGIDKVRKLLEISNVIYHPTWMVKKKYMMT